jgi:hypothetical protein
MKKSNNDEAMRIARRVLEENWDEIYPAMRKSLKKGSKERERLEKLNRLLGRKK